MSLAHALDRVKIFQRLDARHRLGLGQQHHVLGEFGAFVELVVLIGQTGQSNDRHRHRDPGHENAPMPGPASRACAARCFAFDGLKHAGGEIRRHGCVRHPGERFAQARFQFQVSLRPRLRTQTGFFSVGQFPAPSQFAQWVLERFVFHRVR